MSNNSKYKLRRYQRDAIIEIIKHKDENPLIVLPSGVGKTIIACEISKIFTKKKKKVLYIAPYLQILKQVNQTFIENNVDMEYVTVIGVIKGAKNISSFLDFDVIITDEAHHAQAHSYLNIYKNNPKAIKIGMTATPVRLDGKPLENIFGYTTDLNLSCQWYINHGYLSPFSYYASSNLFNDKRLMGSTLRLGDYSQKSITKTMSRGFGDIVDSYKNFGDGQQAILYAHDIKHAKQYSKVFNDSGIPATYVYGNMIPKIKEANIKAFKNKVVKILCNVDLLSEGFDMPDATVSILLRPTLSKSLYLQQAMRTMRPQANKKAIIIDHTSNGCRFGLPNDPYDWTTSIRNKGWSLTDERFFNYYARSNGNKVPRERIFELDKKQKLRLFKLIESDYEFEKLIDEAVKIKDLDSIERIISEYNAEGLINENNQTLIAKIIELNPSLIQYM